MIIAKKSENEVNIEPVPAGTYQAVCYGVWDIGIQTSTWNGEEKKQHKIVISWELDKIIENEGEYKGKRYVISNRYTLSLGNKATLRSHLESWRGKPFDDLKIQTDGFDIEKLIGANCFINVVHTVSKKNGKTYANISTIMKCTKGTEKMKPENGKEAPEWVKKLQGKKQETLNTEGPDVDFEDVDDIDFDRDDSQDVPF